MISQVTGRSGKTTPPNKTFARITDFGGIASNLLIDR